jgi:4-amino-4-deoxy-L-arabinose transferase-like glycosyltransferase
MFGNNILKRWLKEHYVILVILIGVALISIPMGPYRTLDTQLEFSTAQGVLKWGYPYYNATGNLFNEPPLGFYTEAAFLQVFGVTEDVGVVLIMLFGLAATFMVYKLGKELYSKSTGLFAAACFGLASWEIILSRSFLIDTQCLFLSMVYLYFGILAIRKNSIKFAAVAGIFFAAALLTKLFAVFMLVPLLVLYIYNRPRPPKQVIGQLSAFSLPAVVSTMVWYQVIAGKDILYLIQHNDFVDLNFANVDVSYWFVPNFLVNYGLGVFFFAAVLFSLFVGFIFWKQFSRRSVLSDVVCLATILSVLGIVMYMAVNLNLKAPYTSAIKYIYQSLPFFSLIAASLASKSAALIKIAQKTIKAQRVILLPIGVVGLFLLVSLIISSINTAVWLATINYIVFRVQPNVDVGYSFFVLAPLTPGAPLQFLQFFGFLVMLFGLFWASRNFITEGFLQIYHKLKE